MKFVNVKNEPPGKCKKCSLFFESGNFCAGLSTDELCELSSVSATATLRRGESFGSEALRRWPVVAIASGVVSLQHVLEDGRKTISALFLRGDIIDLRSDRNRNRGNLVALRRAECCKLSPQMFDTILSANPGAHKIAWKNLRDQTLRAVEHSADLAKKKALEKLASFIFECRHRQLKELPEGSVDLMIRRIDLADYLGMQPETVSRCFRELEDNGVIGFSELSAVKVQDIPALRTIANGKRLERRVVPSPAPDLKILSFG